MHPGVLKSIYQLFQLKFPGQSMIQYRVHVVTIVYQIYFLEIPNDSEPNIIFLVYFFILDVLYINLMLICRHQEHQREGYVLADP